MNKLVKMLAGILSTALVLSSGVFVSSPIVAADENEVIINEKNFPDSVFRKYVHDNCQIGTPDDILTEEEIANINFINLGIKSDDTNPSKITDLTGIEYFTFLCSLEAYNNNISSIDLSSNTELYYLDLSGNPIKTLDVSSLSELFTLNCYNTKLTGIDLSKNSKLEFLDLTNTSIRNIDLSNLTKLSQLVINDSELTTLDISKNSNLLLLSAKSNKLKNITLGSNSELKELNVEDNLLSSIDLSGATNLTFLDIYHNELTSLDVSKNTLLTWITCGRNHLTSIDLSNNNNLEIFYASDNQLNSIRFPTSTTLKYIDVIKNNLNSIDVSSFVNLQMLMIDRNNISSIDISKLTALETLTADRNPLTSLDVSNNTKLLFLSINNTDIESIDISSLNNLGIFESMDTGIVRIDFSGCPNIIRTLTLPDVSNFEKDSIKSYYKTVDGIEYRVRTDINTEIVINGTVIAGPEIEAKPIVEPIPTPHPEKESPKSIGEFVDRCYSVTLGREADPDGYQYWCNSLNSGDICGAQAGYGFIFSSEYINKNKSNADYVTDLYSMYFGRTPDSEGFAYWTSLLDNGKTREEIMAGFANSLEFYNLCGEYGVVQGFYVVGMDNTQQGGINSFVARLYKIFLNRLPDMGGQSGWVNMLVSGDASGASVAYGFAFSPEFNNDYLANELYVACMYRSFLGREPDQAGFEGWVSMLITGEATMEDVFDGFSHSAEFDSICKSYGISPF
ncbi:MAG: DUF4214 domain-containing protein [Clostridia bacterium]|nr:DUF4214 domain-containing protein [Clostridia bacterium]